MTVKSIKVKLKDNKEIIVMKIKMAQYGILHDHAAGKTRVMKESPDVDLAGIYEPDKSARLELQNDILYEGLNWFSTPKEMLEDETTQAIAVQGRVADNLSFAEQALTNDKHIWLDKPAGDDLKQFEKILNIARQKKRLVQLGYMFRYFSHIFH